VIFVDDWMIRVSQEKRQNPCGIASVFGRRSDAAISLGLELKREATARNFNPTLGVFFVVRE
jgi:hypothetical protein